MVRCILVVGIALLAGCQNVIGPFQARDPIRVDDPRLTHEEQDRLKRDRYALPDESFSAGPRDVIYTPNQPRTPR